MSGPAVNFNSGAEDGIVPCEFTGQPFVGEYNMYFEFSDDYWYADSTGMIHWEWVDIAYWDSSFAITYDESIDVYYVSHPSLYNWGSLPATRVDDKLVVDQTTGTLTYTSYDGEIEVKGDSLFIEISRHTDEWTGIDDFITYVARGKRK